MKRSDCQAFCLTFVVGMAMVVGCESLWQKSPAPTPLPPQPVQSLTALGQLKVYAFRMADIFDEAADSFDKSESSVAVITKMGDELASARIESFTPLMFELNKFNGRTDANELRSKQLREWASQLRGEKGAP